MEKFFLAALAVAVLYGAVVALFYVVQREMLFPAPKDYRAPLAAGMMGVTEAPLATVDGETVMVWRTVDSDHGRPTVLFFHGNGDALSHLDGHVGTWRRAGWDMVLATYRGYPGSTGAPSETALVADGLALFDRIVAAGTPPEDIVIAGFSLGSAVAVAVAAERSPRALFLQAPPSAIDEVAAYHYPWLPVRLLMRDRFRSVDRMARVRAPVFIVHGERDHVVPSRFARRLLEAAAEPKELLVLPEAGHVLGPEDGWSAFERFLAQTAPRTATDGAVAGR